MPEQTPEEKAAAETAAAEQNAPGKLHDAAIEATQKWQENPNDETLKTAALEAVGKAKTSYADEKKSISEKATVDKKAAEDKAKAPDAYNLKLPEGSTLLASHLERIAANAKERGLSQEDAQAEVDRTSSEHSIFQKDQLTIVKEKTDKWALDAKEDKEIGGEEFPKNVELAKRVITRFATEEFKDQIDSTGWGNHPEVIRIFNRIGKAMSEDQLVIPGSQKTTPEKKTLADRMYGRQESKTNS